MTFRKVLVPADRNTVLGDAAESGQHALVEIVVECFEVSDRLWRVLAVADEVGRQRLDLQRVDADDAEPFVQKIMRQRITRRPEPHDQRIRAVIGQCVGTADVQRIPARQQTVDLEPIRHEQDVGQHVRLDLRDVDGLRLLIDAALHAVVADAMPGARAHRIVDDDQGQRPDVVALPLDQVHLGDLLFERAAGDVDAERIDLVAVVLAITHAFGARIRIAVVAIDAVIDLVEDVPRIGARVGQCETVAATTRPRMPLPDPIAFACLDLVRHQRVEMGFLGFLEADPIRDGPRQIRIDLREMRPAPDDFQQRRDELVIGALERRDKSYGGSTVGTESSAQLTNG